MMLLGVRLVDTYTACNILPYSLFPFGSSLVKFFQVKTKKIQHDKKKVTFP